MHLYGRNPPTFSGQQHLWRVFFPLAFVRRYTIPS
nr:MAG TPA: hypothetical protein [Bacteriophage sp.]